VILDRGDRQRLITGVGGTFDDSPGDSTGMNESGYAHGSQATGAPEGVVVSDTDNVSSLTVIPPATRRRMAWMLLPIAVVLLAAGLLSIAIPAALAWKIVGAVVLLIAVVLLGVAHGLYHSARSDEAAQHEAALDAAILAAAPCGSDCGASACGLAHCAARTTGFAD
jgi:hypothetical protein